MFSGINIATVEYLLQCENVDSYFWKNYKIFTMSSSEFFESTSCYIF